MSKIIDQFKQICRTHKDKTAFYYYQGRRLVQKTFGQLDQDVSRLRNLLLAKGPVGQQKALVFVPPSYDLVVFMLASMEVGLTLMYVDLWAGKKLIGKTLDQYRPDYIVVSRQTRFLKFAFGDINKIKNLLWADRLVKEKAGEDRAYDCPKDSHLALLTMTTGSTGRPKIALRSHLDLYHQLDLVNANMEAIEDNLVLTTAFMYTFANVLKGFATVLAPINLGTKFTWLLSAKLKKLSHLPITTIITSPDFCLRTKNYYPHLQKVYIGGAILNYKEADQIRQAYPDCQITYIYGATECNLITKIDLDDYLAHLQPGQPALLGQAVKGVEIKTNQNQEIMVHSQALLKAYLAHDRANSWVDKGGKFWHKTGDAGLYQDGRLYYLGRKDVFVQAGDQSIHSNPIEQDLVLQFEPVQKCAFFYHQGQNHLFLQGKTRPQEAAIKAYLKDKGLGDATVFYHNYPIPCDIKHHTKINYSLLKLRLEVDDK